MMKLEIPKGVKVEIGNNEITVAGKLGTVKKKMALNYTEIKQEDSNIAINPKNDRKKTKAMTGTIMSHIDNMIKGVTEGWEYKLKILYLHFPMMVKAERGRVVISNFLGEHTPRIADIIGDTKVEVKGDQIIVTGSNIENVSRTASNIELATKIKAYDRRVFQDGIFITQKG